MDIFDRLGNLIRTILDEDDTTVSSRRYGQAYGDPDMQTAWDELESYMNADEPGIGSGQSSSTATSRSGPPEALRKDFRNLEVPFGAPLSDVRRSYKRLMAAFHPDRHSANPDRFQTATEVTKKLNQSFERIRSHYETAAE